MPNLTVRNIPKGIHRRLRERANSHGRSLNAEILAILSDEDGWERRRLAIAETELRCMREEIAKQYPNAPDSVNTICEDRESR